MDLRYVAFNCDLAAHWQERGLSRDHKVDPGVASRLAPATRKALLDIRPWSLVDMTTSTDHCGTSGVLEVVRAIVLS